MATGQCLYLALFGGHAARRWASLCPTCLFPSSNSAPSQQPLSTPVLVLTSGCSSCLLSSLTLLFTTSYGVSHSLFLDSDAYRVLTNLSVNGQGLEEPVLVLDGDSCNRHK